MTGRRAYMHAISLSSAYNSSVAPPHVMFTLACQCELLLILLQGMVQHPNGVPRVPIQHRDDHTAVGFCCNLQDYSRHDARPGAGRSGLSPDPSPHLTTTVALASHTYSLWKLLRSSGTAASAPQQSSVIATSCCSRCRGCCCRSPMLPTAACDEDYDRSLSCADHCAMIAAGIAAGCGCGWTGWLSNCCAQQCKVRNTP
jgi:hypothetical protein